MRLSMWILNNWLKKYDPEARIFSGEQVLRSARILSNTARIEPQNVYLAPAEEFISGSKGKVICVHGHDILVLNTQDMDQVLNDIFDAFDFYNSWSDGLITAVSEGHDAQYLLDQSSEIFPQPIIIYNAENMAVAYSQQYGRDSLGEEWNSVMDVKSNSFEFLQNIRNYLREAKVFHGVRHLEIPQSQYPSSVRTLFKERVFIGQVVLLENDGALSAGQTQLFDTFGSILEHWITVSDETTHMRERTALFCDLLNGKNISSHALDQTLLLAGWKPEQEKELLRIDIPLNYTEITYSLLSQLERAFEDQFVMHLHSSIFILYNLAITPRRTFIDKIRLFLYQSSLCACISYPFSDVYTLADYAQQCELTLQYTPQKKGEIYYCSNYALQYIHSMLKSHINSVFCHPLLKQLKDYDEKNNGDLYHTLYVYLRNNCNIAKSAKDLNLHRNSLLYRLNQIKNYLGGDMDSEDLREYLLFSYYL